MPSAVSWRGGDVRPITRKSGGVVSVYASWRGGAWELLCPNCIHNYVFQLTEFNFNTFGSVESMPSAYDSVIFVIFGGEHSLYNLQKTILHCWVKV
jgi:hypothetical protein